MPVYVISYDLNKPGQNYQALYQRIKGIGTWCHPVDSTWYVVSNSSALQITNHLLPVIDKSDSLIVSDVGKDTAFFNLPKEVQNWLGQNI